MTCQTLNISCCCSELHGSTGWQLTLTSSPLSSWRPLCWVQRLMDVQTYSTTWDVNGEWSCIYIALFQCKADNQKEMFFRRSYTFFFFPSSFICNRLKLQRSKMRFRHFELGKEKTQIIISQGLQRQTRWDKTMMTQNGESAKLPR